MKRRLVLMLIAICLVFTVFSCSKAPEDVTEQNSGDANEQISIEVDEQTDSLKIVLPPSPALCIYDTTDTFTATVLDSQAITGKSPFIYNKYEYSTEPILYKVEVKSTVKEFFLEENMKIYVAGLVREADEQSEDYHLPLEIGKTYLMCGDVSIYNNKPIILDEGFFSCELKEDGTLVPMSTEACKAFKGIETYDEFLQDEAVVKTLEKGIVNLPEEVIPLLKTHPSTIRYESEEMQAEYRKKERDSHGVVLSEKEEVRKIIKEALPIDSKKTIDTSTEEYQKALEYYHKPYEYKNSK